MPTTGQAKTGPPCPSKTSFLNLSKLVAPQAVPTALPKYGGTCHAELDSKKAELTIMDTPPDDDDDNEEEELILPGDPAVSALPSAAGQLNHGWAG
jgi:hypothetical protein